MIISNAEKPWR